LQLEAGEVDLLELFGGVRHIKMMSGGSGSIVRRACERQRQTCVLLRGGAQDFQGVSLS